MNDVFGVPSDSVNSQDRHNSVKTSEFFFWQCEVITRLRLLFRQVDIHIPGHPRLSPSDKLQCVFGKTSEHPTANDAVMNFDGQVLVTCSLPEPAAIPPTPDEQGEISVQTIVSPPESCPAGGSD